MNATYTGPNGTFTAHKSIGSGTGWVTSGDRYIGGYTSFADAIDFAIYFATRRGPIGAANMNNTLHKAAWATPHVAAYVRQSFRSLDRHWQAGTFETQRALRLLRNNARDAANAIGRNASHTELQHCARLLLTDWRNRHMVQSDNAME